MNFKSNQIISLLAMLLLPSISFSQGFFKSQKITIGLKSGYSDAFQFYGPVPLPPDAETHIKGYNVSLEMFKQVNNYFSFGIEPGLVKRGAACVPGWNGGVVPIFEGDTKFLLDYIEAPITARVQFPLFRSKFSIFGKLGYGPSAIVSAKQEDITFFSMETTTSPITLGPNSILNRWDHGATLGGGLAYAFAHHSIFFEYDYYFGMRDAERFNTSKNRVADFSMGYRFDFGLR